MKKKRKSKMPIVYRTASDDPDMPQGWDSAEERAFQRKFVDHVHARYPDATVHAVLAWNHNVKMTWTCGLSVEEIEKAFEELGPNVELAGAFVRKTRESPLIGLPVANRPWLREILTKAALERN